MIPLQPREVNSRNLIDGRISISFYNYAVANTSHNITYNSRDEEIQSDEEEIHTLAVFISPEAVFIKLLTPTAKLPERQTLGAAGLDLAADRHIDIYPRERV